MYLSAQCMEPTPNFGHGELQQMMGAVALTAFECLWCQKTDQTGFIRGHSDLLAKLPHIGNPCKQRIVQLDEVLKKLFPYQISIQLHEDEGVLTLIREVTWMSVCDLADCQK